METEVIMKRTLFGDEISQKSKSEYFSATELVNAGNKWRLNNGMKIFNLSKWLQQSNTKEFISALEKKIGQKAIISARARGQNTWVHPYLFIDIALEISPELKIEVYSWLTDYLLRNRNDSGDSYKLMAGSLWDNHGDKKTFHKYIIKVADKIQNACGVDDWQRATQEQLALRDNIHKAVSIACRILRHNDQAVNIAIADCLKNYGKKA